MKKYIIACITLLLALTATSQNIDKINQYSEDEIVLTRDIDNFWKAYDNLQKCQTRQDSIHTFQTLYLDRGTDGLKNFTKARDFTAEKFVNAVAGFPKFYKSVRSNTYEVKKAVPIVLNIVNSFKKLYKNFKPKKVCFAIGIASSGGTVSDDFLLIGAEITTATNYSDVSEFNTAFANVVGKGDDIVEKVTNMVAHEYVHTQQNYTDKQDAVECILLKQAINEGSADFIGEMLAGSQINKVAHEYGNKHEKDIWIEFKNELCNTNLNNWFYNYSSVKDKPADLGYYVGYKIAEEYYKNTVDKEQAIIAILETDDPITFLQNSKYDQKEKL